MRLELNQPPSPDEILFFQEKGIAYEEKTSPSEGGYLTVGEIVDEGWDSLSRHYSACYTWRGEVICFQAVVGTTLTSVGRLVACSSREEWDRRTSFEQWRESFALFS